MAARSWIRRWANWLGRKARLTEMIGTASQLCKANLSQCNLLPHPVSSIRILNSDLWFSGIPVEFELHWHAMQAKGILMKVNLDFSTPFPIYSSSIRSLSAPAWWSRRETLGMQSSEIPPFRRRRWRSGTCGSGGGDTRPRRWDTCPAPCGGRAGRLCRRRLP